MLERTLAVRLSAATEAHGLFPDGQIGNRKERSAETAIKFTVQAIRAVWKARGSASLLQLDLKGAFDQVHHGVLLGTLRGTGLPGWLVLRRQREYFTPEAYYFAHFVREFGRLACFYLYL